MKDSIRAKREKIAIDSIFASCKHIANEAGNPDAVAVLENIRSHREPKYRNLFLLEGIAEFLGQFTPEAAPAAPVEPPAEEQPAEQPDAAPEAAPVVDLTAAAPEADTAPDEAPAPKGKKAKDK